MMKRISFLILVLLVLSPGAGAENWMSRLPDDAYVAVLSIPGTHDSATGSGWVAGMTQIGDAWARTQDTSIGEQWSQGIRGFDLRPCVYDSHLNLNHGIVPTVLHLEDVLQQLCDSLEANPSEFVVIHLLHEKDGDQSSDDYNTRIQEVLGREAFKPYLSVFRKDLTVGDMRGKMLILSRDKYASRPAAGGFFINWTGGVDWNTQMQGRIQGLTQTANLVMQDYSDTHNAGGVDTKVNALRKLLQWSMGHKTGNATAIRWVFNFASAYSKVDNIFGMEVSSSDGYRDNATYTHAAIIEFLATHEPGPTGVILMDYAGVDESNHYKVRGREAVRAIIDNNFAYLIRPDGISAAPADAAASPTSAATSARVTHTPFSLTGLRLASSRQSGLVIVGGRKYLVK